MFNSKFVIVLVVAVMFILEIAAQSSGGPVNLNGTAEELIFFPPFFPPVPLPSGNRGGS
ncbi:hypothetical protein TcasGA2_TC034113 [Tribolium castaneum]|uniref:Uncharacterized protein n=1 Tax=Tribolium castaneum TaxID=7070 RepID=A0A139WDF5_TRICA|nr:hypothetical protein TcasGA2_TC034113 [Tribolium castaneum]